MMIPIVDYFFDKIYKLAIIIKLPDKEYSSLTAFSLIEIVTFSVILNLFHETISYTRYTALGVCSLILVMNYYLFLRNKRYLKIRTRYENESKLQNAIGSFFVVIFVIIVFILAIFSI